jgi:hypothetical protein
MQCLWLEQSSGRRIQPTVTMNFARSALECELVLSPVKEC